MLKRHRPVLKDIQWFHAVVTGDLKLETQHVWLTLNQNRIRVSGFGWPVMAASLWPAPLDSDVTVESQQVSIRDCYKRSTDQYAGKKNKSQLLCSLSYSKFKESTGCIFWKSSFPALKNTASLKVTAQQKAVWAHIHVAWTWCDTFCVNVNLTRGLHIFSGLRFWGDDLIIVPSGGSIQRSCIWAINQCFLMNMI